MKLRKELSQAIGEAVAEEEERFEDDLECHSSAKRTRNTMNCMTRNTYDSMTGPEERLSGQNSSYSPLM